MLGASLAVAAFAFLLVGAASAVSGAWSLSVVLVTASWLDVSAERCASSAGGRALTLSSLAASAGTTVSLGSSSVEAFEIGLKSASRVSAGGAVPIVDIGTCVGLVSALTGAAEFKEILVSSEEAADASDEVDSELLRVGEEMVVGSAGALVSATSIPDDEVTVVLDANASACSMPVEISAGGAASASMFGSAPVAGSADVGRASSSIGVISSASVTAEA